jgi:hypothetical protein
VDHFPVCSQVLRGGKVLKLEVRPEALDTFGTARVVGWCGAVIQVG